MLRVGFAIGLCLLVSPPASGEEPASRRAPPFQVEGMSDAESHAFVQGVAYALWAARARVEREGGTPLYCKSWRARPQELWNLLDASLLGPTAPERVAVAALEQLRLRHPCP